MPDPIFGPAADDDTQVVHLFLCLENGHYAISLDPTGSNLPRDGCDAGWRYVKPFALGIKEGLPIRADPEPVIRAIRATGYCVPDRPWLPHGTSQ